MSTRAEDPDGSRLLTTDEVGPLLAAAVTHAGGGRLVSWQLDHVDQNPNQSTTATYSAVVDWPFGRRDELLGVSARASGRAPTDERARIFADGGTGRPRSGSIRGIRTCPAWRGRRTRRTWRCCSRRSWASRSPATASAWT